MEGGSIAGSAINWFIPFPQLFSINIHQDANGCFVPVANESHRDLYIIQLSGART